MCQYSIPNNKTGKNISYLSQSRNLMLSTSAICFIEVLLVRYQSFFFLKETKNNLEILYLAIYKIKCFDNHFEYTRLEVSNAIIDRHKDAKLWMENNIHYNKFLKTVHDKHKKSTNGFVPKILISNREMGILLPLIV